MPLYNHPNLVPKDDNGEPSSQGDIIDADGSITDGDDSLIPRDQDFLMGGGGWQHLDTFTQGRGSDNTLGKRNRPQAEHADVPLRAAQRIRSGDHTGESPDSEIPEFIDLTSSSPPPADITHASSTITVEDDSDDEEHVSAGYLLNFIR